MNDTTLTRRRRGADEPGSSESLRRSTSTPPPVESWAREDMPLCSVPRYMSTDYSLDDPGLDYSSWNYLNDPTQLGPTRTLEGTPTEDANPLAPVADATVIDAASTGETAGESLTDASSDADTDSSTDGSELQCGPTGEVQSGAVSEGGASEPDGEQGNTVQRERISSGDDKTAPLPEPIIARTGYIVAPRVPSPPKEALKRSGDIRQRTGSPPELHHAKIQQAVLRVVDAARDSQRQIVWRTNNLARDTRLSFDGLAAEILAFTGGCIQRIRSAVSSAKQELTTALDDQLAHLSSWGQSTDEDMTQARQDAQQEVHDELFNNQQELSQYHLELQQEFTPYLLEAQSNILNLNLWGEAYHITPPAYGANPPPVPEGEPNQSVVPPGPRKSLKKAHDDLTLQLQTEAGANALGFYHSDRITPVLESQYTQTNTNIDTNLETQSRSLESFRGQFTNYALRLTTPMADGFAEQRRKAREQLTYQITDQRHQLAEDLGEHGTTLIDKFDGVIKHLDKELGPKLEEGLQKAGNQAAKGFRDQGEMTQRMMDNTAASLALAYPELVSRVAEMLPPGQFLNYDQLGPQLRAAWQSARNLPDQQYAAMAEQAAVTLEQAQAAKRKQMASISDSTEKSLQNVTDVVTATQFDFDNFTYQVTGHMAEGGWDRIRGARDFATRMAKQILDTRGDADGALANLLRSFCGSLNNAIDGAGRGYFNAVMDFEDRMTSGRGSVFFTIKKRLDDDLSTRAQTLDAELTKPDTATTTGLVVLNVLTLGATTPLTVGYLVYSDADDDEVFAAFGDLQWPGQPALKYFFENVANKGNLFNRFDECLSKTQAQRARGMFDANATVRGNARESALRNTLTVFGMNSFARESLVKGWHSTERAAVGDQRIDALVRDMNSSWTTLFTRGTTDRMNEGYVRGNLGMVLSARMDANLQQARRQGSDHIYQSVQNIEQLAREELIRTQGSTFITDDQVQQLTDQAMLDFASHHRRATDTSDPRDLNAAREIFIREATAPIYVQRPAYDSRGRYVGGGNPNTPQQVPVDQAVRSYVQQVVRGGWKSEDALAAQQVYEFNRAGRGSRPSRADQVRFTRTFQNDELNRAERELREHPERAAQLMPRLRELRAQQEQRMLRLARRLDPPATDEQIQAAGGATQYMAQRTARLFSGGDNYQTGLTNGTSRSEAQENAQYGYELITQGRASAVAGVRLATRGTGTNEDLLRMNLQDRSKAEMAQTRADWQSRYGESMDAMLGIGRHRGMSGGQFALGLLTAPLPTLMFGRVTEVSGDLANEIEILARGNPETDQDYIELSALRFQHQRRQGTGFLARLTMSGTDEARTIDAEQQGMAQMLLTEAYRQRAQRIAAGGNPDDYPLPRSLDGVFTNDGRVNPNIASLVFQPQQRGDRKTEPRFTGNRDALLTRSMRVEQAATRYQMEIDRQEQLWLAGITVLAIAATLILMAFGVGFVLASVIVALGAGLLTIAVKSGMRGERYGWEEAATDMANTAIEVAAAGAGGAIAGGLGKSGAVVGRLARFGAGINKTFGRVGGAMVREAITGAASSAAQTAIQDRTYDDGPGTAFGRILMGGLKGAAISATSAGVSESLGNRLNRSLVGQLDNPTSTQGLARLGNGLGPTGRNMLKEGVSEGLGGIAGEAMGIYIDMANGQYHGTLQDALQRMGQAGLKDMIRSGGRAGITARHRTRYNQLAAAARDNPNLSRQDLQALRAASMAAGDPPRSLDEIRQQNATDRHHLSLLPPELQRLARSMDSDSLGQLVSLLHGGQLGQHGGQRLELFANLSEKNPALDFAALRQQMELNTQRMARDEDPDARQAFEATAKPLRDQITADLPGPVRDALADIPVRGLEHLPPSELPKVARMLANGTLNPRDAEALVRAAQKQNPDLDAVGFLKNLNSAVQSARMAQDAHTRLMVKQRATVLGDVPAAAVGVIARLPDDAISTLKAAMDSGTLPAPHRIDALLRQAQAIDPSLDRSQFQQHLQQAVSNAQQRQQTQKAADRAQRQLHMTNVPEHLRGTLSVLPDAALVELHLRQMEGSISPAERLRLEQAALRENPDLDLKSFNKALDDAIEQGTPIRPSTDQEQQLRREMQAAVPPEQRSKVANVPILILPDSAFARYARSDSGNAVTVILHGKPVVILRQGADPKVLREEGIHALQAQDPKWAKHIGSLDETRLSRWEDLPLDMQIALYRNKLELEIDAHDRMVNDLANQLLRSDDPTQQQRLRVELELVQRTLRNLENRLGEVDAITPLQRLQIRAGVRPTPQYLLQPARLFNKARDDLSALIKQGVSDNNADARRALRHLTGLSNREVNRLLALGLDPVQLRSILKSGEQDAAATRRNVRQLLALARQLPEAQRSATLSQLMNKQDYLSLLPKLGASARLMGNDPAGALQVVNAILGLPAHRNAHADALHTLLHRATPEQRLAIAEHLDTLGPGSRSSLLLQSQQLLRALAALPATHQRQQVMDYVISGFASRDASDHSKDIRAAVRALDPSGGLHPATLQRFADNLSNRQPMSGGDAFRIHLEDKAAQWDSFRTAPESKDFARLLEQEMGHLPHEQMAALADLHPWFRHIENSDYFQQRMQQNGTTAEQTRIELLHEIVDGGLRGRPDISNHDTLRHILSEVRQYAAGSGKEPNFDAEVATHLARMGIDPNSIRHDQHDVPPQLHLENLVRQRIEYQNMLDMALGFAQQRYPNWNTDADANRNMRRYYNELTAGLKQKVTETSGEIAATHALLQDTRFNGLTLLRGFEAGTGFDQVWVRRQNGVIVDILIVEAKGHKATLGDPDKGLQMGPQWVMNTVRDMLMRGDDGTASLIHDAMRTGYPPIRGVVIQADQHGNPGSVTAAPGADPKTFAYPHDALLHANRGPNPTGPAPRRTPAELAEGVQQRIRAQEGNLFQFRYSADDVDGIVQRGQQLGLSDKEIGDLMFTGSREKKPIAAAELMQQMDNYVNIVRARGFPFRFDSVTDFVNFSTDLKALLLKYNLPVDDIRVQGSSLRSPQAKDVDIAVFIDPVRFHELTDAMLKGLRQRAAPHVATSMTQEMRKQIEQGRINSYYFDRMGDRTFNQELRDLTKHMAQSDGIDLSLMLRGRDFDISPAQTIS